MSEQFSEREMFLMKEALNAGRHYESLGDWLDEAISDAGHIVAQHLAHDADRLHGQSPSLSSIAQKKLDQMGATVHGVLVKNEAGAWATVSDAGRVMWLDGFEGQAARAQGGEAVPVGRITCEDPDFYYGEGRYVLKAEFTEWLDKGTKLYTRPSASVPDWMADISSNLKTQDNRITADPLFVVFQKGTIVVDEDYDHDRIVWVDDEGNEADTEDAYSLSAMRQDMESGSFMDDEIELIDEDECRREWRRLAIKEVDEFVTACFTEVGAESYLKVNGHNLRKPYIFVTSLFRNMEMINLRNWLISCEPDEGAKR